MKHTAAHWWERQWFHYLLQFVRNSLRVESLPCNGSTASWKVKRWSDDGYGYSKTLTPRVWVSILEGQLNRLWKKYSATAFFKVKKRSKILLTEHRNFVLLRTNNRKYISKHAISSRGVWTRKVKLYAKISIGDEESIKERNRHVQSYLERKITTISFLTSRRRTSTASTTADELMDIILARNNNKESTKWES